MLLARCRDRDAEGIEWGGVSLRQQGALGEHHELPDFETFFLIY